MQRFCEKRGYEFVDLRPDLAKEGDMIAELTTDGTHLIPEVYFSWGNKVRTFLKDHLL